MTILFSRQWCWGTLWSNPITTSREDPNISPVGRTYSGTSFFVPVYRYPPTRLAVPHFSQRLEIEIQVLNDCGNRGLVLLLLFVGFLLLPISFSRRTIIGRQRHDSRIVYQSIMRAVVALAESNETTWHGTVAMLCRSWQDENCAIVVTDGFDVWRSRSPSCHSMISHSSLVAVSSISISQLPRVSSRSRFDSTVAFDEHRLVFILSVFYLDAHRHLTYFHDETRRSRSHYKCQEIHSSTH